MAKIKVVEKMPGNHIQYEVKGKKIIFGDDVVFQIKRAFDLQIIFF